VKILEEKYIYRKHLRKPAKFFLFIEFIFIMVYATVILANLSSNNTLTKTPSGLILLFVGIGLVILLSLEFLLMYFIMYRKFKNIQLTLTDEELIYDNSKGEVRLPYENIQALKFSSIKYAGGWLKIIHTNGNIRLTVVLENIGDMLVSLKQILDKKDMSSVYDEKTIYKFFKTSKYSDQSWERIYEIVKFFIIYVVINLGIIVVFYSYITKAHFNFLFVLASILGPLIPYLISEIIFGIKSSKGSSKDSFLVPERDKPFENKLYKWLLVIYIIIYLVVLIIVK